MSGIGVVIVDGQRLIRAGFSLILQAQDDIRVLAEGATADDAVALVERHRPDVVCVSATLDGGGADGFAATRRIRALAEPQPSIVILVGSRDGDLTEPARAAGADRTLGKYAIPEQIVAEVRHAAAALPR